MTMAPIYKSLASSSHFISRVRLPPRSTRPLRETTTPRYTRRRFGSGGSGGGSHQTNPPPNPNHNSDGSLKNPSNAVQVPPPPSWSIGELRLAPSDEDDKISEEELAALARRCLIDVRRLSPERRDRLRLHVAGIMRCASVLLESRELGWGGGSVGGGLTDEEIYDAPRGLGKLPVRGDRDDWESNDAGESNAVMESERVASKMVKPEESDDKFFSVVTK